MTDAQKSALAQFERDAQAHNDFGERTHHIMMIIDELKVLGSENGSLSNTR